MKSDSDDDLKNSWRKKVFELVVKNFLNGSRKVKNYHCKLIYLNN